MKDEVIFDVETKKLFGEIPGNDPGDLGVSLVSTYRRKIDENYIEIEGEIASFWEKDFNAMWEMFQKADRIIGYNTINFDVPALKPYCPFPFEKLTHFDIFEKVYKATGRKLPLNSLAKETLDEEKSGIGIDAVYLWKQGTKQSLEKLKQYCELDVLITKKIYDFALKNKKLHYKDKWNTPRTVKLDFSFELSSKTGNQTSLF